VWSCDYRSILVFDVGWLFVYTLCFNFGDLSMLGYYQETQQTAGVFSICKPVKF